MQLKKINKFQSVVLFLILFAGSAFSSPGKLIHKPTDNHLDTVPLILNNVPIYNDSSLSLLFQKLYLLKKGEGRNVSVLHLGDSHVQMGFFAAAIRNTFSKIWGFAGFGTVFPYQLAKYNPFYIQTKVTNGEWEGSNYLKKEDEFKHGVLGFTARTFSSIASFELNIKNNSPGVSGFNKVQLLYGDPAGNYTIELNGSSSQQPEDGFSPSILCNESVVSNPNQVWRMNSYCFDKKQDKIQFTVRRNTYPKGAFNVYGFVLKDESSKGVIYNSSGVGGSQFSHLTDNASLSKEQITSLQPDLILFSYGSNESYMKSFDSIKYQANVNNYIHSLKKTLPGVTILLISPPDTRAKNLYPRNTTTIQQILKTTATQENVAYLDLREQMGGDGSIWRWLPAKLAASDKLHFTKEGYTLQANLVMQAFIQSYNKAIPEKDKVPDINLGNYIFGYGPNQKIEKVELPDKMKNK
jgi:lysophospholipase L1-like esterase